MRRWVREFPRSWSLGVLLILENEEVFEGRDKTV